MTDKPTNLAAALAEVQANLPAIVKGETATVPTKAGGKYSYSYADLADVSAVILPMLGKVGLSWITKPTFNADGKFVLAYKLLHVSGDTEVGEYPLSGGTPQEIGSAITYARRYALCAVTGVAPAADDDDGAAATRQAQRSDWDDARPAQRPETVPDVARQNILGNARRAIATADEPGLTAVDERISHYLKHEAITTADAVELRRLIVVRLAAIRRTGEQAAIGEPVEDRTAEPEDRTADTEQSDLGGEWPEPRKPGSGDPA